ncbi:MAG: hypothetical protein HRU11_07930 [Parvularculaceae bacterium]|nr:hypothetical protein [Parvularculaceae bacterium]
MNEMTKSKAEDRRARVAHGLGAAVGAFVVGTIGLSVAIYVTGGETVAANGFTGDEMGMFEVTSSAAVGMAAAVIQLVMGLIGMITAMGAAIFGLAIGAIGIAGAVIVGAGIVTGPILLLAGLVILIKRRFYPDVI